MVINTPDVSQGTVPDVDLINFIIGKILSRRFEEFIQYSAGILRADYEPHREMIYIKLLEQMKANGIEVTKEDIQQLIDYFHLNRSDSIIDLTQTEQ